MRLMLIRHLWGVDQPLDRFCTSLTDVGYEGLEINLDVIDDPSAVRDLASKHHLQLIAQLLTTGPDVAAHLASFQRGLQRAAELHPMMVNCHAGRDAFSPADARAFFEQALDIEKQCGIDVAFETHRSRILYNPWATADLIERFDALKLCADLSHWVCVAERLIDDQIDLIRQVADRTIHLHARVGYEQGPQVPDPAADVWRPHVEAHERWWDIIWQSQKRRGLEVSVLTPEFGPPPYLHCDPRTGEPVVDLATVCDWQARRQRRRFEEQFGS